MHTTYGIHQNEVCLPQFQSLFHLTWVYWWLLNHCYRKFAASQFCYSVILWCWKNYHSEQTMFLSFKVSQQTSSENQILIQNGINLPTHAAEMVLTALLELNYTLKQQSKQWRGVRRRCEMLLQKATSWALQITGWHQAGFDRSTFFSIMCLL